MKKRTCDHELLTKHGVDLTDHRKRVFDVISESSKALTPKVILDQVRKNYSMDKVTLYRILELFVSKKIVRRIAGQPGQMHYEIVCEAHRPEHSHFVCRECGDIECLKDLPVKAIKAKIRSHKRWQDNEIDLKLEGVCVHCKKEHQQF